MAVRQIKSSEDQDQRQTITSKRRRRKKIFCLLIPTPDIFRRDTYRERVFVRVCAK
jgi:hypothetical protein